MESIEGSSWQWSYGSWIYNYLCNECLSPLQLWAWISIRARFTTCDKVCHPNPVSNSGLFIVGRPIGQPKPVSNPGLLFEVRQIGQPKPVSNPGLFIEVRQIGHPKPVSNPVRLILFVWCLMVFNATFNNISAIPIWLTSINRPGLLTGLGCPICLPTINRPGLLTGLGCPICLTSINRTCQYPWSICWGQTDWTS
jgi:hypothetical protein